MTENLSPVPLRVLAASLLYETLIVIALVVAGIIIPFTLLGAVLKYVANGKLLMASTVLLLLFYFVFQWIRGGQTLAMKTWRLKLVTESGLPITPAQAVLRFSVALAGCLLLGINFIWAFFDSERRFLQDRIAGTLIVRTPR